MGLFNWFSWQLERRAMLKEMDRLRADLSETERQLYYAKRDLAEAEQLLHEAQIGAKQVAEEYDKLKAELNLQKSEAADWENVARNQQRWIAELRRPASELTSVTESTEQSQEEQVKTLAREIYIHGVEEGYSPLDAYELAKSFHSFFERGCRTEAQQENQNNGPF